jgi:hypothetical protein
MPKKFNEISSRTVFTTIHVLNMPILLINFSEAGLLNKNSGLATALGLTKFLTTTV